jgi:ribosomal protein S18 acetylase RimI-like enzyme
MDAMQSHDAAPEDAGQIVHVMRQGYDPAWLDVMLYGCEGVEHHVEAQIRLGQASQYRYRVQRQAGEIVGVAEFRFLGKTLSLNNIVVLPAGQGAGVGRTLLREMVREAKQQGRTTLSLDVLETNVRAMDWYRRLGLETTSARSYWLGTLPRAASSDSFVIPDLPQADAVHARFGFSEFSVEGQERTVRVGRLGMRYFRLLGRQTAGDRDLLAFLGALEPERKLLAILDGARAEDPAWHLAAVAKRMSGPLESLRLQ